MDKQQPISPVFTQNTNSYLDQLVNRLRSEAPMQGFGPSGASTRERYLIEHAFFAGSEKSDVENESKLQRARDEQLEACCEWINRFSPQLTSSLRAALRPKPHNLADPALQALDEMDTPLGNVTATRCGTIRAALKKLKKLEENQ